MEEKETEAWQLNRLEEEFREERTAGREQLSGNHLSVLDRPQDVEAVMEVLKTSLQCSQDSGQDSFLTQSSNPDLNLS